MSQSPVTSPTLLIKIRDHQDATAWSEFCTIYQPLIHRYAIKRGLQDSDAADVAQDVVQSVMQNAPTFQYDPRKGSFRGWLFTVTRNKIRNAAKKRTREVQGSGETQMHELLHATPSPAESTEWDEQYQWQLFRWAAESVRGSFRKKTFEAFSRVSIEQQSAEQVAAELEMSVGAVYIAKSRVMKSVIEKVREVDDDA